MLCGGSEEYDVEVWSMMFEARSMMFDVVFAPKQRKLKKNDYLKINSP